jgi:hypothetical protein
VAVAVLAELRSVEKCVEILRSFEEKKVVDEIWSHSSMKSGSGWVAVVPLDRGDRRGHFGIK